MNALNMYLRIIHHCHPNPFFQPAKIQTFTISSSTRLLHSRPRTQIPCRSSNKSPRNRDSNLASDFAVEVSKMNTHVAQREDAMKKGMEMLYCELCKFLDSEGDQVQMRWDEMNQEEKTVLVQRFVDEWGANFHPLSAKSVKELIEEHIRERKTKSLSASKLSSPPAFFPGLRRLMGFASE